MSDANLSLRDLLARQYSFLLDQLSRRLRSTELAQEALHDTYLRLERGKEVGEVHNPVGYLFRVAINAAIDHRRLNRRLLTFLEIDGAFDLPDDAPDPAREVEARSEMNAFQSALSSMPKRRQAIFLAYFSEGLAIKEIAKRFGLSNRMIDLEIRKARDHCAAILNDNRKKSFRSQPPSDV